MLVKLLVIFFVAAVLFGGCALSLNVLRIVADAVDSNDTVAALVFGFIGLCALLMTTERKTR